MNAKLLNLAILFPFWNSLDWVRRVHSDLEFAAIVFFALLAFFDVLAHRSKDRERERIFGGIGLWCFGIAVLCELAAYPYGQRNDTLSEKIIGSLSETSTQAAINAHNALADSNTGLTQSGLAKEAASGAVSLAKTAVTSADAALATSVNARKAAESVEKGLYSANRQILARGPRAGLLTLIKDKDISDLLSKFPNQKICERSVAPGDPYNEATFLAESIVGMLVERPSGHVWMHSCTPNNVPPLPRKISEGAELVVAEDSDESTQLAAEELQTILRGALILDKYGRTLSKVDRRYVTGVPRDEIQVWVGEHP